MLLFIIFSQLLAIVISIIVLWLIRPVYVVNKRVIIVLVFIVNNITLVYGLSDFWQERFQVYLVVSILQGFMIYAAIITAIVGVLHRWLLRLPSRPKLTRLFAVVIYFSIVSVAVFNAYSPVIHRLTVLTDKPLAKPITIALVSDTHLGRWFGNQQIDNLIALIDKQKPDVVVLAGDIMNDTTIAYDNTNMHNHLSKLKAPLGVYAVLGNHDYLGYQEKIAKAVSNAGITVLDNQSVKLNDSVWLVGRSDDVDLTRLSANELLDEVDTDKAVVFLEHRPSAIDEISPLPIDLHLSGHTHGGQIFPLTIVMRWFSPLVHGTKNFDNTQFVVTSGYGFGPVPFRLGTRSEIWLITLESTS